LGKQHQPNHRAKENRELKKKKSKTKGSGEKKEKRMCGLGGGRTGRRKGSSPEASWRRRGSFTSKGTKGRERGDRSEVGIRAEIERNILLGVENEAASRAPEIRKRKLIDLLKGGEWRRNNERGGGREI